jgi:hypothetical protein
MFLVLAISATALSCGGDDDGAAGNPRGSTPASAGDAQTPAAGAAAMDTWLQAKHHLAWKCEPQAHAARPPSPHGRNRVCSNALMSAHGQGEYPVGAAAVKEIYDGDVVTGHAVFWHVKAGATGDTWYFYEKLGARVVADGLGDSGVAKSVCVACHQAAGSDPAHPGHDFVYTQVR